MLKSIIKAKKISDSLSKKKTVITSNIKDILLSVNDSESGVIIDLPWNADADGIYMDYINVLLVKVTKDRIFFINPVKSAYEPCEIKADDLKGPERIIHEDGQESMLLGNFFSLVRAKHVSGIIRQK